jgi:ribose transport system permease protein
LSALAISAQTLSGDARLGLPYMLTSIAALVIGGISLAGGRGSVWGAVFGALALGLIANVIYFAGIPSIYQEFFKGVVICVALSFTFIVGRRRSA